MQTTAQVECKWVVKSTQLLNGILYGVNATYMTESFASRFRGSAVGGAYNIGV
jgi:AAHS family cis,cis-muconate transporter-like MFS transporter